MNTLKFLEEVKVLENKLSQKVDNESGRLSFPALVKQLFDSKQIGEQIVDDLKKIWEFRNQIYFLPTPNDEVPDEVQTLLVTLINNVNLQ